jgi:hypothetical protein
VTKEEIDKLALQYEGASKRRLINLIRKVIKITARETLKVTLPTNGRMK